MIDQEIASGGPQNAREVNAWRQFFVANEWSELQCENRIIEPETSFIWFVFFWIGLGWKEFCASDPELTNVADPNIRQNVILKFFWVALIFYGVGIGRIVVSTIRAGATGTDFMGQMIDLATLANISIVVMDEPCHGYYVYGKAPWGKADIPLHIMQRKMQDEVSGELGQRSRGLKHNKLPNADSKIQTFEIYMPKNLREEL